jgi:hypothetical protein
MEIPMRKYAKENRDEFDAWLKCARQFIVELAATRFPMHVSTNDLYTAIVSTGKLMPPPDAGEGKRGQLLCNVMRGVPYFSRTDTQVFSNNPLSKGRKVWVWEYRPEFDERSAPLFRKNAVSEPLDSWS